jgi:hypothetical protein
MISHGLKRIASKIRDDGNVAFEHYVVIDGQEVEVLVTAQVEAAQPDTYDDPGCPASVDILSITINEGPRKGQELEEQYLHLINMGKLEDEAEDSYNCDVEGERGQADAVREDYADAKRRNE